jgi:hypothetical protein
MKEVRDLMRRSRGCELPSTFSPFIIGELFTEQCRPWRGIAVGVEDDILQAVYRATQAILPRGRRLIGEYDGGVYCR